MSAVFHPFPRSREEHVGGERYLLLSPGPIAPSHLLLPDKVTQDLT